MAKWLSEKELAKWLSESEVEIAVMEGTGIWKVLEYNGMVKSLSIFPRASYFFTMGKTCFSIKIILLAFTFPLNPI